MVRAADGSPELNAWVVVRPDDTVVIRIARSEMGQGTLTGLAQLVAEELECDWSKVTTEFPTPGENAARKRAWGDFSTGGSRGIRNSQDYVRKGGAIARVMLIQAAADEWKVPPSECAAANSVITHTPSGRTTSFGKVAQAAARLEPPAEVKLKDPKDWKLIGKNLKRLDTPDKTTGATVYGIDIKLPGMLNAAIKDCPVTGGTLKSYDEAKIAGMKGVRKVVRVGDSAVAVVADTWWHAKSALEALPIVWDEGPNAKVTSASIAKWLAEGLDSGPAFVGNKVGDAPAAIAGAVKKIEAVYSYPYQNHATLEPMNATAVFTADKCEVWCGTQNGEAAFAAAVKESGLPANKVDVYKQMLGGGFGRRGDSDYVPAGGCDRQADAGHADQAVVVARGGHAARPLSSDHAMQDDRRARCRQQPGRAACADIRPVDPRRATPRRPDQRHGSRDIRRACAKGRRRVRLQRAEPPVEHSMRNPHIIPGFWRGVNVNQNALYTECFMDELAHAAGQDPLAFRRKLMADHPKNLAVLNAVADKIGWGRAGAAGRLSRHRPVHGLWQLRRGGGGNFVAEGSKIKVLRIVAATDPGYAVNPAQIERQIAGSFVYGLSGLFYGGCTVKDGYIEQTNFDTYNSMRMAEMPKVESIVMPSGGFWGGVGEPTISVAGPAVLNAYFAATGKRVRSVPLRDQNITFA